MKRHYGFVAVSLVVAAVVVAVATGTLGAATQGMYRLVGLLGQVLARVQSDYVEEVGMDRLEKGALTGLVEAADPGGAWVPAEHAAAYQQLRRRPVPPFGVVLGKRSTYPVVLQVVPGSPAAAAGIEPGELIERVGDQTVRANPLWEAELRLATAETAGAAVTLDIIRRDLTGKRLVTVTPAPALPPTPTLTVSEGTPVLRVVQADEVAAAAARRMLADHRAASAVVVDLTGTALGSAGGAASVAAVLTGTEVTLRWAGSGDERGTVSAKGEPRSWRLFVCIDGTTAHAGELVALGLEEAGATLVGRPSFGDTGERRGTRRDGGHLWLAHRWFLAADGTPLLGTGLEPDEVVRGRAGAEAILQRALELARGEAAADAA